MKAKREDIVRWCVLAGVILILTLILIGCGVRRKTLPSQSEVRRDSIYTKVVERTVYKRDTVRIHVPQQVAVAQVKDSISRLENDWAVSTAHVYRDGTLRHTLETKAGTRPIETETPIVYRDSIVYQDREVEKEVTKEVRRPFFSELKSVALWLCAPLGLAVILICVWRYKK